MSAELIRPCRRLESSYRSYIKELGSDERYPFPLDFDHADFDALLARLDSLERGVDLDPDQVPSSTFWLVEDDEILGVSNLRHHLNSRIREFGGHIGLGIRPSAQGRGLGSHLMRLTIEEAAKRGIAEIHVHCYQHNAASGAMIRSNGGELVSECPEPNGGHVVQRFVIAHRP